MLEQDLQEIGLNEKEAKIYLAALELGQSTVQDISKKSQVNRATAYFVIEALMRMGLMSSFHKGKKQYFVASDPEQLSEIIRQEGDAIIRRAENLKKVLPQLKSINNKTENRPVVKYYEGKEGVKAMVEEFFKQEKNVSVSMAYSWDAVNNVFTPKEQAEMRQKRVNNNINSRAIYTSDKDVKPLSPKSDARMVPSKKFPITCDIAVYPNRIRLASLTGKIVGIVIEDKELAKSLKSVLELAWEGAEKYQNNISLDK